MPHRINAGQAMVVLGGLALLASLFLDWYDAGINAWEVFEIADLVLAALAILAVAVVFAQIGGGGEPGVLIAPRWIPWVGVAALAFIVVTLLNDPPAARQRPLEIGAWIGLGGAFLIAAGGVLSSSRISIVISSRELAEPGAEDVTEPVGEERDTEEWLPPEDERQ
jgi:hypothetical protein